MSAKRYIVRLSEEERARLNALLRQNRLAAQKRTRAQVLLKVDEGEDGPAWTDAQAAAAFDVHEETVRAIRCRLVERGLDAALEHLLADRLVHLEVVDSLSYETVRRGLKKTTSRRTARWAG